MADTAITVSKLATSSSGAININSSIRPQVPVAYTGSFVADDTDFHSFIISASGKGRLTYAISNPSNKDLTVTLYGLFSEDAAVGDIDAFGIDTTGITVSATGENYDTTADPFPFYLIRCKFAATPDSETVTIYTSLMAF